jgi:hypothetical protein
MIPDREIHVPGEGLLPPSTVPLPPADLRPNQRVRVIPPCPPWRVPIDVDPAAVAKDPPPQLDRRYWRMVDSLDDYPRGLNIIWRNRPSTPSPFGDGFGVDSLPEPAIFDVTKHSTGNELPDVWEGHGLFYMSGRLLEILIDEDPEAVVHKPIQFRNPNGETLSQDHHLVDVVRTVAAVDYANSIIDYAGVRYYDGEDLPSMSVVYFSSRFVDDINPRFKIFRQKGLYGGGRSCFVADDLRQKIQALSPPARNIAFHPLSSWF